MFRFWRAADVGLYRDEALTKRNSSKFGSPLAGRQAFVEGRKIGLKIKRLSRPEQSMRAGEQGTMPPRGGFTRIR
ncbi:hypothetical protein [Aurantimonas marianensis]|uniref:Uncharacterized protein n=1 Tax=Aurantimonas marianensis TaxID=2920428 RepID=A0A9X2H6A1_9HYPH|nr:hypothetical protein [Aurantimonas marianensis]MCP3056430.1 hypothetical protein [Aurantimonas marianensis]